MLDLYALVVLREVARCGSFGQAARALAYTPPAVSQRISALERDLDVRLFDRSSRGVSLTPAGRLLLEHADRLLQQAEIARADLAAAAGFRRGRVRLGTFATAAAGPLVEPLRIARTDLGLEVEVEEAEPSELLPRLLARELDLAVVFSYPDQSASLSVDGRVSADESGLARVPLGDDPLVVVVDLEHRHASRGRARPAELAEESFIPIFPLVPTLPSVERHLGFRPRFVAVQTTDYHALLGLVASGLGAALVPRTVVAQARRDDIAAVSLAGQPICRRVEVALPPGGHVPRMTSELIDTLVSAVKGLDRPTSRRNRRSVPGRP